MHVFVKGTTMEHDKKTLDLIEKFPNLDVMKPTQQLIALHTIIRNKDSSRSDFVFYSDRLIRLTLEDAISTLDYEEKIVTTPTGEEFVGMKPASKLCGVSILRAGESMEYALRAVAKSVRLGKILIQRNETSEEKDAVYFYSKLPEDVAERSVLLLDPMLATGGSVCRAIKCLLDHKIPESKIIFVNLVACPEGIEKLMSTYPKVRVVTSMIDDSLDNNRYILPGLGDFGDRYFGTS
eukprot:83688_1